MIGLFSCALTQYQGLRGLLDFVRFLTPLKKCNTNSLKCLEANAIPAKPRALTANQNSGEGSMYLNIKITRSTRKTLTGFSIN